MLSIVGVGSLGEVMLQGLLAAGWSPDAIRVVNRRAARSRALYEQYKVHSEELTHAVTAAHTVMVCVKPQNILEVLKEIAPHVTPSHTVISVAAGVPTTVLERHLGDVPVVRGMPNTPARVGQAVTVLSAGSLATEKHMQSVEEIFTAIGKVWTVPERQMNAVTALSGSGPAYFYYVVEALIDAGILLGIPRHTATEMITQTVLGAAAMLHESGDHPVALREAVTSPGGSTIQAVRELEKHSVRAAIIDAVQAAHDRSRAIAEEMSTAETDNRQTATS